MATSAPTDSEKLELVFLKLGLAETDDELQSIVYKFLNPVLSILATNDENIRAKVLELLTHLNKRLKAREVIQLPIEKLLDQMNDSTVCLFTKNFATTYMKTGFSRLPLEDRRRLAPLLFTSVEGKPKLQQNLLLRLVVENLPLIDANSQDALQQFEFLDHKEATHLLLDFCLDFLLLPYSLVRNADGTLSCPPGLSLYSMQRLLSDSTTRLELPENVESIKLSILRLLKSPVFSCSDVVCHFVVASADTKHTVATNADVELKRLWSAVEWNDMTLNLKLYKLYLGQAGISAKKPGDLDKVQQPADIRMKLKLIITLTRSRSAGDCFPQSIQVVYDGLFGQTNSKLQLLTLQFVTAMINRAEDANSQQKQAPFIFEALVKITKNEELSEDFRSMAFIGLGILLKKFSKLFQQKMLFVQSLWESLETETSPKIKDSIRETLVLLASVCKNLMNEDRFMLEKVVEKSIESTNRQLQDVGVLYAATVFPHNHLPSRYQLILALSQAPENVSMQAHKCLFTSVIEDRKSMQFYLLPSFTSMLGFAYEKVEERVEKRKQHSIGGRLLALPPKSFRALIVYLRKCLLGDTDAEMSTELSHIDHVQAVKEIRTLLTDHPDGIPVINKYMDLCLQYLNIVDDPLIMLLLLEAIASSSGFASFELLFKSPSKYFEGEANSRVTWLRKQINHINEDIRCFAAESYAIVMRQRVNSCDDYADVIEEQFERLQSKVYEAKHGSVVLLGHVVGDWLKLTRAEQGSMLNMKLYELAASALNIMVKVIVDGKELSLSLASCKAIQNICRKSPLPLDDGEICDEPSHENDKVTKADVVTLLASRFDKNAVHQLRESIALTLGVIPVGDPQFLFTEKIISILLKSAEIKDPDLHLSIGAALCSAALGPSSPETFSKWESRDRDLIPARNDSVKWLLDEILSNYVVHRIPAVRQASAVWLMVVMKTCARHPAVKERLIDLHDAFQSLLMEADDFTQDIASKGFGIVYSLADADLKKLLVDQLVASLTGSKKYPAKVRVLDQEGSLVPGSTFQLDKKSNISTYKELCSFASDLNQPDLIYKFMQLVNHNSSWNSKKGAAFGFRSIVEVARQELSPHLPILVSRLYRYTFDPQPQIRQAMTSIWNVMVPSPQHTISDYFSPILDDLLLNLTSSVWRTREASCCALSNFMHTGILLSPDNQPRAQHFISKLPELWRSVIRVADDVKETVRKAALDTCKSLQKVTVRLCDDAHAGESMEGVLPEILLVLLENGLSCKVADVAKLSLNFLVDISKLNSTVIKPCLPQMIGKLLEALSDTEDPRINYLHTRSSTGGQSSVDQIRVQMVRNHPLMETARRCVEQCTGDVIGDVIAVLCDLIKRAVGTLTKAGCTFAVRSLAASCRDEMQPFCGKLINALLSGLRDRSTVICKLHAQTIGALAPIASDDVMEKLSIKMRVWYLEKQESSHGHASVVVLQAVASKSPDVLSRHAALVLPIAFYGMHQQCDDAMSGVRSSDDVSLNGDKEERIDEMWKAIWNEFTAGEASALHVYFGEILELCSSNLQSSRWSAKIQAARALSYMIGKQHSPLVVQRHLNDMLQVLLDAMRGRVWSGKHHLVHALRDVSTNCAQMMTEQQTEQVLSLFFSESKRNKMAYKVEAILGLSVVIHSHGVDRISQFWDLVAPILQKQSDSKSDSDDDDEGVAGRKLEISDKVAASLVEPWSAATNRSRERYADEILSMLCDRAEQGCHTTQLTALTCLHKMLPLLSSAEEWEASAVCHRLVPTVCTCLGDVKYSSTRENALEVLGCLVQFRSHLPDEDMRSLHATLKGSPLNSSVSLHYERVSEFLTQLSPA